METDLYHVSKQRHRMLFEAVKFDGFSRIDGIAEPDFHHLANAVPISWSRTVCRIWIGADGKIEMAILMYFMTS